MSFNTPRIIESKDFNELKGFHLDHDEAGVPHVTLRFSLHPHKEYAHSATEELPDGHPVHGQPTHLHLEGPGAPRLIEILPEHRLAFQTPLEEEGVGEEVDPTPGREQPPRRTHRKKA